MTDRPGKRLATTVVACLLALGGVTSCSGDGAADRSPGSAGPTPSTSTTRARCAQVPDLVVRAVQRYMNAYGTGVSGRGAGAAGTSGDTDLKNALSQSRDEVARLGCDVGAFRDGVRAGLSGVTARGPVAQAVLLRLEASVNGDADQTGRTRTVRPGDDVPRVLAGLAAGATLRLAPGTYRLDSTLVLLQGVTLRGAGRDRTRLVSTAADSAVLVLTDGRVELRDLALRHRGSAAASGLIGGPTSSVVLTGVTVGGARGSSTRSAGGAGVLMSGRDRAEAGRGTTLEVTGSDLRDNTSAGILLLGAHRASIRGSRFAGNGQCGVCFTGRSSGAVRGSTFAGNGAGVAVVDDARPALVGNRITGGQVGIQAGGRARPLLRRNVVVSAARAGLVFGGTAAGRVEGTTCRGDRYGIVVAPRALPLLGTNDCAVARSR